MLKAERAINEMQMCLMVVGIFDFLLSLSFNVKVIVIQGLGEGSFIQSINLYWWILRVADVETIIALHIPVLIDIGC